MTERVYDLFMNPTAAYRGKPFWSWNGKLDKEELLRQIHVFKEMGFGGFFMHSRTGLITEYLSDEWFELINACANEAEKLGMEAWLYDEDRWPSGTAGGLVTEEPRYRLKFIRLRVVPAARFEWRDSVIAAFACKLDGMSYTECRQLVRGGDDWRRDEMPTATDVLEFSVTEQDKESFYNGYTYLDTMNREAVERFIALTHDKYFAASGGKFGKSIKGIFTDEPHRGALMDGFGLRNDRAEWLVPWTYGLFERFAEKYGYDPIPHLPELFLLPEGKKISQVKWHYTDLLQELFHENFAIPIGEWCRKHNLLLTGHILHEDSLAAQTAMIGSVMRFYEHMDVPGVDVLTEGNVNYWIVKQLSSAARQLGKTWLLSELYGCTGWQMPLEGHKSVGDWQALFGINLRCHHLSWYTMEGEAKRDFPASISHQSAWWQDYETVEGYFSRLSVVMSQGTPVCDLLVLNPVESLWCQIYPGWSRNLAAQSPEVQQLERHYSDTFHWLAGSRIDFDYGDEEMLTRLARVERDSEGRARLRVGEAVYRAVLVTGMTTIRSTSLNLLESFMQAGGHVIFAGEAPAYVDALSSGRAEALADKAHTTSWDKAELIGVCRKLLAPILTIDTEFVEECAVSVDDQLSRTGDESLQSDRLHAAAEEETEASLEDIYAQVRTDGDITYAVLMNMNRKLWRRGVKVRIRASGAAEEWLCATGERLRMDVVESDGMLEFVADFPPSGEHVYVFGVENLRKGLISREIGPAEETNTLAGSGAEPQVTRYRPSASVEIPGPYEYRLDEPNVCVLDIVSYRLDNSEVFGPREILKADRDIRRQLGLPFRSGEMIQPWYANKYLGRTLDKRTPLELIFQFHIEHIPRRISVAIERPEQFVIRFNERTLSVPEQPSWWVDPCFQLVSVPAEAIQPGLNTIRLTTMFNAGMDLESIYLLGDFGVRLDGGSRTITKLPELLEAGDITSQGLPFYGGAITLVPGREQLEQAARRIRESSSAAGFGGQGDNRARIGDEDADRSESAMPEMREENVDCGSCDRLVLSIPSFEAACIRMRTGERTRVMAWQPYEAEIGEDGRLPEETVEIDLVLTRRNTFGPLHQYPLHAPAYGPPSWVTEGKHFSEAHVLLPSGLLSAPQLTLQKPKSAGR